MCLLLSSSRLLRALAVAALALAAVWPAVAGNRADDPAQQTSAALYRNYCSVCHGDKGDGQSRASGSLKPAPRDFTSPQSAQHSRERMIAAVKLGVPGTAMTGWQTQLSDKQIALIVDYVRTSFMVASAPGVPGVPSVPSVPGGPGVPGVASVPGAPGVASAGGRGQQIYARTCSVCHGERGSGSMWASANLRPAPRDFSAMAIRGELTRERMIGAVAAGRPNTAMNGYATRLSRQEMEAVVDYIRTAFMTAEAPAGIAGPHARGIPAGGVPAVARLDVKAAMPNGLKGDAVAGRKFYDANCATCHGVKGDGQGPRAYFINPKPRMFTSTASRAVLSRPVIYEGVASGRRGSEMPAWDKVLTPQQIADVSEYVFRAFIRPGKGDVATKQ